MLEYNERITKAKERLARKEYLEGMMPGLQSRYNNVLAKTQALRKNKIKEQKDVDRLESNSLSAFLLNMTGRKEERLEKEQIEANLVTIACDEAEKELAEAEASLYNVKEELETLQDCEKEFDALIQEKRKVIENKGLPIATEIARLEKEFLDAEKKLSEVQEAYERGSEAQRLVEKVLQQLCNAGSLNSSDMHSRSNMPGIRKTHLLVKTLDTLDELDEILSYFDNKIAGTKIKINTTISLDADTIVNDALRDCYDNKHELNSQIKAAVMQADITRDDIMEALEKLYVMQNELAQKKKESKERMYQLIIELC